MSTQPPTALGPDEHGLDEDVPCPKCQYNLRGLTVPRCPECGSEFAWADVPRWREEEGLRREQRSTRTALVVSGAVLAGVGVLWAPEEPVLLILIAVAALAFAISGTQACLEMLIVSPMLAPSVGWGRFRAWWEGVLIGYGVSSLTIFVSGYGVTAWDFQGFRLIPSNVWGLSVVTTAEACVVQWWVVRRRTRQWNDPIPSRHLFLACLLAKAILAIPWAFCPFRIMKL